MLGLLYAFKKYIRDIHMPFFLSEDGTENSSTKEKSEIFSKVKWETQESCDFFFFPEVNENNL